MNKKVNACSMSQRSRRRFGYGRWLVLVAICTGGCRNTDGAAADEERAVHIVALGRMLFFERALSADGQISCAFCHRPELAYADGLAHASGTSGREGTRNTLSLLDVARQRSLFWDGRRARLDDQALDPLLNEAEHGLRDEADLLNRLRADARYAAAFQTAYGVPASQVTVQHVSQALAAFERVLSAAVRESRAAG